MVKSRLNPIQLFFFLETFPLNGDGRYITIDMIYLGFVLYLTKKRVVFFIYMSTA